MMISSTIVAALLQCMLKNRILISESEYTHDQADYGTSQHYLNDTIRILWYESKLT